MTSNFTADFFKANRQRLTQLFTGKAPIVITANGLLQRNNDSPFPFRQDSNFWYLTGIDEPDVTLVIDKDKEYLIVPGRSDVREAFDGEIDFSELTDRSGIKLIMDEKTGWKQLASRLHKSKHVAVIGAASAYVDFHGFYTNPARARLVERIKAENADIELLDLRQHMLRMRSVKQPEEIAAIQAAIDITAETLKTIQKRIGKFAYEYEVEAAITAGFRKKAAGHAYQPIVAAGVNACTLHYLSNNDPLPPNDLILLDVGAEVEQYAADITRTYAVGEVTKRQESVWQAVMEVHDFARSLLRPGVKIIEYEKSIEQFMGEKLRELGLIKLIESEQVRKYYPHATSHFLGLDVHDVGDYDRPLEPGMVLTVEPGIYIPEERIGIRIEDDILVTTDGIKVLSERLPKTLG